MKTNCFIIFFLFWWHPVIAQDSVAVEKKVQFNGYIKSLQSLHFDKGFDNLVSGNLVHNRLNLKWKPVDRVQAAAEFRNRIFWGETVAQTPSFTEQLKNRNELLDLDILWISKNNFVAHTNTERLWAEYRRNKWNLRAGRQRINWGVAVTWNPGDLFNAYNFLDFDFEERPGTDAIKFQYQFGDFSHLELAVSPSDKKNNSIAAARYFMNKWGYDLHFVSGLYRDKWTAGLAWAGSIGEVGYKGEGQLFINRKDAEAFFNFTMELDYAFKNGWYINAAMLHNERGLNKAVSDWSTVYFEFSPENLMPAKWNTLLTVSKEITPLFNGRWSVVYSPNLNLVIVVPSFSYNLCANLDADLVWQSFFIELAGKFQAVNHNGFLRFRFSF